MLAIRMQRTGRKGHAQFRVVVQDAHRSPTSGKIVTGLGHYDPHTKTAVVDKEKASFYLEHGAQPSDRVIQLLAREGVKLPNWVNPSPKKSKKIRHGDKLRKNRPAEPEAEKTAEKQTEQPANVADVAEKDPSTEDEKTISTGKAPEDVSNVENSANADKAAQPAETVETEEDTEKPAETKKA